MTNLFDNLFHPGSAPAQDASTPDPEEAKVSDLIFSFLSPKTEDQVSEERAPSPSAGLDAVHASPAGHDAEIVAELNRVKRLLGTREKMVERRDARIARISDELKAAIAEKSEIESKLEETTRIHAIMSEIEETDRLVSLTVLKAIQESESAPSDIKAVRTRAESAIKNLPQAKLNELQAKLVEISSVQESMLESMGLDLKAIATGSD